jgi:hypothetical protein
MGLGVLAAPSSGRAQGDAAQGDGEAISCLLAWTGGFDTSQVAHFAADIADACPDSRAIAWEEKARIAERSLSIFGTDAQSASDLGDLIAEWKRVLGMIEREKQHLADEIRRRAAKKPAAAPGTSSAPAPAPPPRGGNAAPPAPVSRGIVRFTVAPGEEPWLPAFLKDTFKGNPGFNTTIASVKGAARIRHDNAETALGAGMNVLLRPGDVVATGADGEVGIQFSDGSKMNMGTSTEIMWSNSQACLGSFSGYPLLVRGVLEWTEGGNRLRSCPKTAETRHHIVALRGAAFTLKYGESNGRGVTTVAVQDGSVRLNDGFGEEVTVKAGAPRTFEHPVVSPLAGDVTAKAILDGRLLKDGDRLFVPLGAAGIWIDATRWMIDPEDPAMSDHRTFESMDGEVGGGMYYDPNVTEHDALRDLALASARKASPQARIVREEWRKVHMLSVLYLELEISEGDQTEIMIGEYFSGAQGTAALVIQVPKDKLAARRAEVAAVLDSLMSVDPFSLR